MRLLAAAVFALAVAATTLAGSGLAVAPHVDPPGMPRFHDHVLAAYRYPLFLLHRMAKAHDGPGFTMAAPLAELAGLVLALLALPVPRLPRPTRRPLAYVRTPRVIPPQWRAAPAHAPPRA